MSVDDTAMTKARIRQLRGAAGENSNLTECLDEIDRLQSFTRRGQSPDAEPEPLPQKAKGKSDPRLKEFLDGWEKAYQEFNKEPYPHGGAKDTQAIKRLLLIGPISDLLDTAWEAWKHPDKFNCTHAITIAGFASRYPNIKLELKTLANAGRPIITQPAGCNL